MRIRKVISTAIMVNNCINIYTDPDNIRKTIEMKFLKKCYKGGYIVAIVNINQVGQCEISQDGSPSIGKIPVTFEVEMIVYASGEIINGCVIRQITNNDILICETEYANIWVHSHPLIKSLTVGQIISIRVGMTKYGINTNKIAINAKIFLPGETKALVYYTGQLSNNKINERFLADVLARIQTEENELENIKKTNPKALNFFTQMLSPYIKAPAAPPNARVISLKDILKDGQSSAMYLASDPRVSQTEPKIYAYEEYNSEPPANREVDDIGYVMLALYENYCSYLRTMREMISTYSTDELVLKHQNLWMIYKKSKAQ